jgi:hypothetical protein
MGRIVLNAKAKSLRYSHNEEKGRHYEVLLAKERQPSVLEKKNCTTVL